MKKYLVPEMTVSVFDSENVVTGSDAGKDLAIDAAKSTLDNMSEVKRTFTVELLF